MTRRSRGAASTDSETLPAGILVVMGGALVAGIVSLVWGLLLQRTGRRRVEVSLDERLRFESLLSELSASLIDVSMSDLDGAIERGLQRVGTFLKVDRANLHEYGDEERSFVSRGPRTGSGRCPASWSLISSRGPPSSSGEDTSSDFPGWTSSPSRRRSTGRAIKEAVRNQTCRSPSAPASPSSACCPSIPSERRGRGRTSCSRASSFSRRSSRAPWSGGGPSWPSTSANGSKPSCGSCPRCSAASPLSTSITEITRGLRRIVDFLDVDQGRLVEFSEGGRLARITHSWMAEAWCPRHPRSRWTRRRGRWRGCRAVEVVRFSV